MAKPPRATLLLLRRLPDEIAAIKACREHEEEMERMVRRMADIEREIALLEAKRATLRAHGAREEESLGQRIAALTLTLQRYMAD
jgi:phage host-nuclease inhibitor protein Gam